MATAESILRVGTGTARQNPRQAHDSAPIVDGTTVAALIAVARRHHDQT